MNPEVCLSAELDFKKPIIKAADPYVVVIETGANTGKNHKTPKQRQARSTVSQPY